MIENGIDFEEKPTLDGLKDKHALKPDFYIPSKKIIIECQGEQHFQPVNFGGLNDDELNEQQAHINKGLQKIIQTEKTVNELKQSLKVKGVELNKKQEETSKWHQ